jgi:hypothetical protein
VTSQIKALPLTTRPHQVQSPYNKTLVGAYSDLVQSRIDEGWSGWFVTFMFDQLPGSVQTHRLLMINEVQRVYSTFLTRAIRNPSRQSNRSRLPILIGSLDMPIYKRARIRLGDASINDGLHAHAVLLVPPQSRLRESVPDHFRAKDFLYRPSESKLARIDARPLETTPERATSYVLKAIGNGRLEYDDSIIVLPRSATELN